MAVPIIDSRNSPHGLNRFINKSIVVELRGNRCIWGTVESFDDTFNMHLQDAYELVDDSRARYIGTCIIERNTIVTFTLMADQE